MQWFFKGVKGKNPWLGKVGKFCGGVGGSENQMCVGKVSFTMRKAEKTSHSENIVKQILFFLNEI